MNFWTSGTGAVISGSPEAAFVKEMGVIPNNTTAIAKIISFTNVSKENKYTQSNDNYLSIVWKIQGGDFVNREVIQKIKCFDGKPEQIDRALNMLMLVTKLCGVGPCSELPTDEYLKLMNGKILGIKIREWSMPKADGSGIMEGNHVAEVHPAAGFQAETGVKLESHAVSVAVDSALSRNSQSKLGLVLDDDIPF